MNWNELKAIRISELAVKNFISSSAIQLEASEEEIRKHLELKIKEHFHREKEIENEAHRMMESLAKEGKKFDRHKLFPLLKAKLAKAKGLVL